MIVANIQLGKNGVTENFITTLKEHFKNYDNVRISVLKSCCRDKAELRKISDEILEKIGKNFTARNIGYTIVVKRWRKDKR